MRRCPTGRGCTWSSRTSPGGTWRSTSASSSCRRTASTSSWLWARSPPTPRASWRPRSPPASTSWSREEPRRARPRSWSFRCGILGAVPASPARAARQTGLSCDVPRAAVYCRISSDPSGLGLGVERQRLGCHDLGQRNRGRVVGTYVGNDVSAYSGKPRPQYLALMQAVRAGQVDVVVAWDPDRLHRSPMELEDFIAVVERAGVEVFTVQAGRWDLSTANGKLIARMLGSIARHESDHKSERVRRAMQQNAVAGRAHGRRAYGWRREYAADGTSREVIVPAEAAVVRRIADALLSGESLRSVTAGLNDEGVPSPTGKPWAKGMVRALVLRERNAGLRVYRGEVVGEGVWEPIVDRGRWEQLRAVLTDPERRTSTGSAAAHLLSGIGRCG